MGRTQVYLGEKDLDLMHQSARATDASRSALIRRTVWGTFSPLSKTEKLRALKASAGSRSDPSLTGAEYVDAIRGNPSRRMPALLMERS